MTSNLSRDGTSAVESLVTREPLPERSPRLMIDSSEIPEVPRWETDIHSTLSKKLRFLLAPFVSVRGVAGVWLCLPQCIKQEKLLKRCFEI